MLHSIATEASGASWSSAGLGFTAASGDQVTRPPHPEGVQSILDDLANGIFSSAEAVNQHLARRMSEYNRTPQPELGGLSPDQTAQLLHGDWISTGALRVVGNAPIA